MYLGATFLVLSLSSQISSGYYVAGTSVFLGVQSNLYQDCYNIKQICHNNKYSQTTSLLKTKCTAVFLCSDLDSGRYKIVNKPCIDCLFILNNNFHSCTEHNNYQNLVLLIMGYDEKQEKCITDVKMSNGTASKTNSHNNRTSRIFGAKCNLYLKSIQ